MTTKRPNRNARLRAIRLLIHDHLCVGAGDYCTGPGREDHARRTVHRYAVRLVDADDVVTEARRVVHDIGHPRCSPDNALDHCPADNKTVHVLVALVDPELSVVRDTMEPQQDADDTSTREPQEGT